MDSVTAPYWRAAAVGELRIQWCEGCRRYTFPPTVRCPACRSRDLDWRPVSGSARVHSYCVVRQASLPGFAAPYAVICVELQEQAGLHLFSSIDLVDGSPPAIGTAVTVTFEHRDWGTLPVFVRRGPAP